MKANLENIQHILEDELKHLRIKNILLDWKKSNADQSELTNLIRKTFKKADAELFSSIEADRLETLVLQADLKKRGNVSRVRWITADDDQVCQACHQHKDQEIPVDDIHQLHPAHQECRCMLEPQLDISISDQELRDILD